MTATSNPRLASSLFMRPSSSVVVVGPEPHAIANALVRQRAFLDRCFPTGERQPRPQVFGVRHGRERPRLQPEPVRAFATLRSTHRPAASVASGLRARLAAVEYRGAPPDASPTDLSDDRSFAWSTTARSPYSGVRRSDCDLRLFARREVSCRSRTAACPRPPSRAWPPHPARVHRRVARQATASAAPDCSSSANRRRLPRCRDRRRYR